MQVIVFASILAVCLLLVGVAEAKGVQSATALAPSPAAKSKGKRVRSRKSSNVMKTKIPLNMGDDEGVISATALALSPARTRSSKSCNVILTKNPIDMGDDIDSKHAKVCVAAAASRNAVQEGVFRKVGADGEKELTNYGMMLAGAIARSASATAVHPLNLMKVLLQTSGGKEELRDMMLNNPRDMMRGAGSQFICSVPHGAFSFAVIETTKKFLAHLTSLYDLTRYIPVHILNPLLDFLSSCVSTFICSVISTPQMVITDRIMAGIYPNFFAGVYTLYNKEGIAGFYTGWLPSIVQKIPSYALTWMLFQQLKIAFRRINGRAGNSLENTLLGSGAAAGACCFMIPMDTVKTRIVMQKGEEAPLYSGIFDCLTKTINDEGIGALYRALPPRLMAVMPMIGIQFSVYEFMKRWLLADSKPAPLTKMKIKSK